MNIRYFKHLQTKWKVGIGKVRGKWELG